MIQKLKKKNSNFDSDKFFKGLQYLRFKNYKRNKKNIYNYFKNKKKWKLCTRLAKKFIFLENNFSKIIEIYHPKLLLKESIFYNMDIRNKKMLKKIGKKYENFDGVIMDPPWKGMGSKNPTRGVTIKYDTLSIKDIQKIDMSKIQKNGFIFLWVTNFHYENGFNILKNWGYEIIDTITWIKTTTKKKLIKGPGYYLLHSKEICLVGKIGSPVYDKNFKIPDIIIENRKYQSQKPLKLYSIIESFLLFYLRKNIKFCEIFGRKNNLRDNWVTIGNEL
jgi:N6-adenosine-specific RNA methylase IME4